MCAIDICTVTATRRLAKAHTAMARCHAANLRSSAEIGFHMEQAQIAFQMALASSSSELGVDALGRHIVGDGLGRMEPFHDLLKFWNRHKDASA